MAKERIVYDKSFKENAVKLSYERKSIAELARELGISSYLIYRWRKEFESFGGGSFPGNGIAKMTPEEKEVARWSISEGMSTQETTIKAFNMAVRNRKPTA
ncbi:MAG: transposase [Phocaeicola sp.]